MHGCGDRLACANIGSRVLLCIVGGVDEVKIGVMEEEDLLL